MLWIIGAVRKLSSIAAFVLLIGFFAQSSAAQKSIAGHWKGVMVRESAELPVSFDFTNESTEVEAKFNSPTQRAIGIPLRNVNYAPPNVHFELVGDATTIVFDGKLSDETIAGQFREGGAKGTFSLKYSAAPPPVFKQEEITFQNGDVTLHGTLLLPSAKDAHLSPAVVFLHGAGPEARYASRFLAEYLTEHGIAALIYDKRGVGKSTGDWQRSDFNDLARDAVAGIHFLQKRKEIDPRRIGVYGHSQGGMIAPLVASLSNDVAFLISGAGSAVPVYESEINSIVNQVRAEGFSGMDLTEATEFIKMWVEVMRTGQGWEQFDKAVEKARHAKWFPMLHMPPKGNWIWAFHRRIYDYNAADFWAKVSVPVLVIYGERDLYVPVTQSIWNIDRALSKARNRDYTILVLPRASHSFDVEPETGQPFEWRHMAPGFPALLTAWIHQRMQ
jgi:pimeloyl-ACP methyl ester carboxylesterase